MNTKYLTLDNFDVLQLSIQSLTCQYDSFLLKFNVYTTNFTPHYTCSVLILQLCFSLIHSINCKTINYLSCLHLVVLYIEVFN